MSTQNQSSKRTETLLVPVMYGSDTMLWKKKERSRIRAVQMDNLKRFAGYQEDGQNPECMDEKIVWSDEMGRQKVKVFFSGSAMWREWRMIELLGVCWKSLSE